MPEIRHNLITGDWVILVPERAKRPEDFKKTTETQEIPSWVKSCPFCPGHENASTSERFQIDEEGKWLLRCVPNKYSVLNSTGEMFRKSEGLKRWMGGIGLHEVIIETPKHNQTLALLPHQHLEKILFAYQHRFLEFYRDPHIEHVIIFKNHGSEAGTSLEHPHSQIVGTPVLPGQVRFRLDHAMRLYDEIGSCLYCKTIQEEQSDKIRIIEENDSFIAFIPYAALSPFHLWIFPKKHDGCFGNILENERKELAILLRSLLIKLYKGLNNPPYNYVIRSLSPEDTNVKYFHWYLAIVPRISKAAGFELGTGMYVNTNPPEKSAQFLRDIPIS